MQDQQPGTPSNGAKKLAVYNIIEREGLKKAIWSRVGTAFVNRDGSLNVFFDAFPLSGRVQVREEREREADWKQRGVLSAQAEAEA
jgi:hypothetical protein